MQIKVDQIDYVEYSGYYWQKNKVLKSTTELNMLIYKTVKWTV